MLTTTETVLFITVWTLTGCGLFFGTKAKLRRRREASTRRKSELMPDTEEKSKRP